MASDSNNALTAPSKGIVAGFKEFIARGNAIELAVGVVIGAAFKSVVDAIVEKFINPLVAGLVGKPNFDNVFEFQIRSATVQPGAIITQLVNFLLVAIAIYLFLIVPLNRINRLADAKGAKLLQAVKPKILSAKPEQDAASGNETGGPASQGDNASSEIPPAANTASPDTLATAQQADGDQNSADSSVQLLREIRDLLAKKTS